MKRARPFGPTLVLLGLVLLSLVLLGLCCGRRQMLPWAARWLDVGEPPTKAEYVVVLGGDVNVRPLVAAALFRAGLAAKVLVSDSAAATDRPEDRLLSEPEVLRRVLLARGVPDHAIVFLGKHNRTTYDEARALEAYLQGAPPARVSVVTSDYHTRRTRWIFRQVLGPRAAALCFVSAPSDDFRAENWWQTEHGFVAIIVENLKFLFYLLRYGHLQDGIVIAVALLLAACTAGLLAVWAVRYFYPGSSVALPKPRVAGTRSVEQAGGKAAGTIP
jgi:uncharacterized SAM-binding protein YcdF (DUF218 family)